jgi:predicted nucleotidyltransferase
MSRPRNRKLSGERGNDEQDLADRPVAAPAPGDRPQAAIDAASEADQRSHAEVVANPVEAPKAGVVMTAKEQRDVALALKRMREAFYNNHDELNVEGIIEAIEEYVTARLEESK